MSPAGTGADGLAAGRAAGVAEHVLDHAGRLFAERGVRAVGMRDVAAAAGCSRATLYRYFESREALRTAYVHRESRRVAREVAAQAPADADPAQRLEEVVVLALRRVRETPELACWFDPEQVGTTATTAYSSAVIAGFTAGFLGDAADEDTRERARWVVRVMLSLLALPGADEQEERRMVHRFVAPVVTNPAGPGPGHAPW